MERNKNLKYDSALRHITWSWCNNVDHIDRGLKQGRKDTKNWFTLTAIPLAVFYPVSPLREG